MSLMVNPTVCGTSYPSSDWIFVIVSLGGSFTAFNGYGKVIRVA